MSYPFSDDGGKTHPQAPDVPAAEVLGSSIAGSWYPGAPDALRNVIAGALARVPAFSGDTPDFLILPHAGYAYSLPTAAWGLQRILHAPFRNVVILAPSHRVALGARLCAPEAAAVETPLGRIPVNRTALAAIARKFPVVLSDRVHAGEHACQIQYPLLQYALGGDCTVTPLIVGELDRSGIEKAAAAIRDGMSPDTLLLVSSDFTHYGSDFNFAPFPDNPRAEVEKLDAGACERILERNVDGFLRYIDRTGATICGYVPIAIALAMLPESAKLEKIRYATSSDDSGDFDRFVGYAALGGVAGWAAADRLTDGEKQTLLQIARRSIRYTLDTGRVLPVTAFADEATPAMRRVMGCFVTLNDRESHELRGCIGEISGVRPLFEAVTARALDAAFGDPRFPALTAPEFDGIEIEISALTPERPVDSWRDIVIGKHGMTLRKNSRSAVFLPQVAPEQGWDLPTTLTFLARKAGLRPDDWKSDAAFTVFEAIVFNESMFPALR